MIIFIINFLLKLWENQQKRKETFIIEKLKKTDSEQEVLINC